MKLYYNIIIKIYNRLIRFMQNTIDDLFENDAIMQNVVAQVGECKIKKNKQHIYAYLVGLIVGQKIRFSEAQKIRSNLYTETGSYNFTPDDIMNLSEDEWNNIGASSVCKKRILNVTKYFMNRTDEEINKNFILSLKDVDGIGEWTIQTLLIEYGLDMNLFPTCDKHVNKQLKELFDVDKKQIDTFIKRWSPYKSIAFWYLWKFNL
jgi:DNA-3-methyladenine glycosylase II